MNYFEIPVKISKYVLELLEIHTQYKKNYDGFR